MSEEITVRLKYNEVTGEKEIHIDYEGEDDATPIEHERRHKAIIEELLGQGILNPDDLGKTKIGRTAKTGSKKKAAAGGGDGDGDGGVAKKEKAQA